MRTLRQKAPSAKRCIKTRRAEYSVIMRLPRQKAPSAKRRIKTPSCRSSPRGPSPTSESAERQKVHYDLFRASFALCPSARQKAPSAKRCIKTV